MQTIWTGQISFSLVSIPVRLYSATDSQRISFRLLHEKDNSPIHYRKFCEKEQTEVPDEEIVKGYEFKKGHYVILEDKDFKNVEAELGEKVDLFTFVDRDELEEIWMDRPYYLVPDDGGEQAYSLFVAALEKSNKVGIARTILREREYLACLLPHEDLLILELMRFAEEIRDPEQLSIPEAEVEQDQLDLAVELIEKMGNGFNYEEHRDEYNARLKKVIEKKARGEEIAVPETKKTAPVEDLAEALRKSIEEAA